jgi:thiol-disulfide isomerase/thioredoxin
MKRRPLPLMALLAAIALAPALRSAASSDAEQRVLDYVRTHVKPGQPLVVSELYSKVFTKPDERQALNKLYNAFFRIPLFVVQYQQKFGKPPRLKTIAQQFDLASPEDAEVLLRVMEDDPRVPAFMTRDATTGEITKVNVEAVVADARFGRNIERHLGGWEGTPAPEFKLAGLTEGEVDLQSLGGKPVLLYIWFTGCPPCMKETPELVKLDSEYHPRGLVIVGANADRVLGLGYDDAARRRYVEENHIAFPVVNWTRESDSSYGHIAIFPTLFLIGPNGVIMRQWVGYTAPEALRGAISEGLGANRNPAAGTPRN